MPKSVGPVARILNLVKLERKEITAIYFYAILNGLIQLSLPLGVQSIIGFVLGASMRSSLVILIILVVTGVLVAGIMQVNQMKIIEKIRQKIFVRYAFAMASHIPKIDLKKTDNIYLPELTNRFFDIPVLQKSLSKILLDIPTSLIQILFGLILLSFYHSSFIIFGLLLIILIWLMILFTGSQGLETSMQVSNYKYRVANWLQETARVVKSIKLAKSNDLHLIKTDELVSGLLQARNSHFRILLLQFNALIVFKTIVTAAMLTVGTMLLVDQQINIGQFIAAEIIILLVLSSVEKLIMNLGSVYDTMTSIEKISNLTDKPVEEHGTVLLSETSAGLKVEIKKMSFGYNEHREVLTDISLKISPGDKVCISGTDSSGKSTLLKLMAGAYTDFKGAILLDDVPVANYNLDSLRSQIGVLLSQQDIFSGTVWENITLGNEQISMHAVNEIAVATGLHEFIATLKNGYDSMLDPAGKGIPNSIIHKILLVRAMAAKPRLLLLEEPWLKLDDVYGQLFFQHLNEMKNTTLVVVSNDEKFALQYDQIINIRNGRAEIL